MTDCHSLFPPGTVHAVYTEKDSVCCGGHFLTPQVMDRFVSVLGQIELDPSRTNDLKGVDFFRILENFIREALNSSSGGVTRSQLYRFVLELEKYTGLKVEAHKRLRDRAENEHIKRRNQFLTTLQKKRWVQQLNDKLSSMSW